MIHTLRQTQWLNKLRVLVALLLVAITLVALPRDDASASAPSGIDATLADYWAGNAEWTFHTKLTWSESTLHR